jgi:hypothetical protein
MAGGQKPSKERPQDFAKPQDPAKIKTPIQLAAQIISAVVGLATIVLKQHSWGSQETLIVVVLSIVSLGPLFPALPNLPQNVRAPLILNIVRWICVVWIIGMVLRMVPGLPIPWLAARQSPAETTLKNLMPRLSDLRGVYQRLPRLPARALEFNRDAEQVAQKIQATNDEELGLSMQIFKYESLAYAYGMVTGSEMLAGKEFTSDDKSKAVDELLSACEKLKARIDEANRPQPVDEKLEKLRAWLVDDAAKQRLLRLTAVGLCFRSQTNPQPEDRANVRKLFKEMDSYYIAREHPELSYELQPCLSGK